MASSCTIATSIGASILRTTGECIAGAVSDNLSALFIAAVGAFFGAYGAQWIAERQASRRRLLEQLRATNTAIALCSLVLASVVASIRQHITPLVREYADKLAAAEATRAKGEGTIEFLADLQTIPLPNAPEAEFKETLFTKVDSPARLLTSAGMGLMVIDQLRDTIAQRNSVCGEFLRDRPDGREVALRYFGFRDSAGHRDERYKSLVDAIETYSDNAAMFWAVTLDELVGHAQAVAMRLGRGAPKPSEFRLPPAFNDVIPDPMSYAELLVAWGYDPAKVLRRIREPAQAPASMPSKPANTPSG